MLYPGQPLNLKELNRLLPEMDETRKNRIFCLQRGYNKDVYFDIGIKSKNEGIGQYSNFICSHLANIKPKAVLIENELKIIFVSTRRIEKNEEICWDYKSANYYDWDRCFCGKAS